jgi:integrase/recombinase XerD
VTHLKKLMLEELERRNYAVSTTRAYLRALDEYARYFNRPPDQLGPDHIRQYQAYLFRERKLQPNTVFQHLGGIRFFYIRTLKQSWSADLTPYPKKVIHLPSILSREEVNSLIEAAPTPFQRTLLMALYATGLRRAELARLKITDIDSGRNVIHVQGGKGRKDRDVMLSSNLLEALRQQYRSLRRKPAVWLFPGNRWHTADHPISPKVIWQACREAAELAGIQKEVNAGHEIDQFGSHPFVHGNDHVFLSDRQVQKVVVALRWPPLRPSTTVSRRLSRICSAGCNRVESNDARPRRDSLLKYGASVIVTAAHSGESIHIGIFNRLPAGSWTCARASA